MEVLQLTARELLFAASELGAETFFGLPDPFFGMDENDIAQEIVELQLTLEKKGYASLGFDRTFKLLPKTTKLIEVCANCERYIVADFVAPDGEYKNLLFYFLGDKAVSVLPSGSELMLKTIEPPDAITQIWAQIFWPQGEKTGVSFKLSFESIKRAQQGADDILKKEGCPQPLADILISGFKQTTHFYSISMTDLAAGRFENITCICTEHDGVVLIPLDDIENNWEVRAMDSTALCKLLEEVLGNEM